MRKVTKLRWNLPTEIGSEYTKIHYATERTNKLWELALIKSVVTEAQITQMMQLNQ